MKNIHLKIPLLFAFILSLPTMALGKTIKLTPGHQKVITVDKIKTVSIGDPNIIEVNDPGNGNQVIVTAKKPGHTNLILWKISGEKIQYNIEVTGNGRSIESEVRGLLGGIEGIHIYRAGSAIIIEGQLYRGEDLEKVQRVSSLYKSIKNYTKVNPTALGAFEQLVRDKLLESRFEQISVSRAGDTLYLEGYVENEVQKDRALKIAKNIYFRTKSHLEFGVKTENQVWVDLQFMEVMNDKLDDVGFAWPEAIDMNGTFSTSTFRSAKTNVSGQVGVTLKTLVQKGQAKILSNPKILVRDGTKATFDAGGELPIRLISERSADVLFKSYGLHIEIDAKMDRSNKVFLDIKSRISDLDLSTMIDGLPAIVEHKVNTAVDLEYGQTVALAGLIESRKSKSTKKFPFLGHVPILGELFKSRNFRNNHSEFVVFLTPHRGRPEEKIHDIEKQHMDQRYHAMDEKLKFSILD